MIVTGIRTQEIFFWKKYVNNNKKRNYANNISCI